MNHDHHQHEHPGRQKQPVPPVHPEHPASTAGSDHKHDAIEHGGHDKHAGHHTEDFLKRFWICLALTIPVLALSHMIQVWLGFQFAFAGDRWVLLALSTFIYLYGGWPFLVGMIREIRAR